MDYKIKIYKITNSVDNLIYIGSTRTSLERRMSCHKSESKKLNYKLYQHMRRIGAEKFNIELLEERDCYCREIQLQDEREFIDMLQPQLNSQIPFRTKGELKEYDRERRKEYRKENKDKERERHRKYYIDNKDKERERHRKYREENKEKIQEYYRENRDKIREQKRVYEKKLIDEKRHYCEVCDMAFISKKDLGRHLDSNYHKVLVGQI